MRPLIALVALLVVADGIAQQPFQRLWIRTTSRPMTDQYTDLVVDSLGNTFICGNSVNPQSGKYDMLVVKFDKNGVKQWEKTFPGTSGHSVASSMALDPNGHVVVAGQTTWAPPADGVARVIKVSAAGQLLWDQVGTASVGSYWYDVAVDRLGEVTTTGYINNGTKAMRTSHFLANGALAWNRDYSYPGLTVADQAGRYVKVDSNQDIYVCGVNNGFPGNTYNTVVKYSRTSTQQWMRHISNGFRDYPRGFVQMPGNRYAMHCETTLPTTNIQFGMSVIFDSNGVQLGRTDAGNGSQYSARGFDSDRTGTLTAAAMTGPNAQSYLLDIAPGFSTFALIGFTQPDIRTLCSGINGGECYPTTVAISPTMSPMTVSGIHAPGSFLPEYVMWRDTIYGSTANGQNSFAIATSTLTDSKGDVHVVGYASGANGQDGIYIKYETWPLAKSDIYSVPKNVLFTSPRSVLYNDYQTSNAPLTVVGQPSHGTLTMNADGTFSYMPDNGFTGTDFFSYRLSRTNSTAPRSSETTVQLDVQ